MTSTRSDDRLRRLRRDASLNMAQLFQHLDMIRRLLRRRPLALFTDFDGTISEIVPSPWEARISPVCRRHLVSLCEKLDLVAIISGRPVESLARLCDVPGAVYVGNHGLERMAGGKVALPQNVVELTTSVKDAVSSIQRELDGIEGVVIEDKGPVVAIHYRQAKDPAGAETEILGLLRGRGGVVIGRGKKVIEVRPPVEFSKGLAVGGLIAERRLNGGIYMGDDLTDLDAVRQMKQSARGSSFWGVGIAVTGAETPRELIEESDFTLDGLGEVERFLGWLDKKLG